MAVREAWGARCASCGQAWAGQLEGAKGIHEWGTSEAKLTRLDLWISPQH